MLYLFIFVFSALVSKEQLKKTLKPTLVEALSLNLSLKNKCTL